MAKGKVAVVAGSTKGSKGSAKGQGASKGKGTQAPAVTVGQAVTPMGALVPKQQWPVDNRDGYRVGLQHGLLLTAWYNGVFANVRAGAKWDDAAIYAAVQAEYPLRGKWQQVTAYRAYYNGSKHGLGNGNNVPLPFAERVLPVRLAPPASPAVAPTSK